MDQELKNYLDTSLSALEQRLVAHVDDLIDHFRAHVDERFERTLLAMAADVGAQHAQVQELAARFDLRQEEQDVRINRHAALLQSGARQLQRTFDNQEELSRLFRELEERGDNLQKRLFALERPRRTN